MRAQESISQGFVFSQQSQQQVLGLYVRRAELAGFIPRKKYDAPCFFCITLEHKPFPQISQRERRQTQLTQNAKAWARHSPENPNQRFDPVAHHLIMMGFHMFYHCSRLLKERLTTPSSYLITKHRKPIHFVHLFFRLFQFATLIGQRLWDNFLYFPTLEP